jgi:preprotein translocase subunit SecE
LRLAGCHVTLTRRFIDCDSEVTPMSPQPTPEKSPIDVLKWLIGLAILVVAVAGNIYFETQYSAPVRAAGVIILVLVALFVLKTTRAGGSTWKFCKDARMEMRKVVWPTRQETVQSTGLVIVVVAITALILWGVDSVFALLVSHIIF